MKLWNVICKLQYYTYIQQKCGQKPKAKWNQSQKKQQKPKTKSQESSEAKAKSQKPNGHANWLQTAANSTQIRDFGSKMQQIQARSQKPKEPEAKSQKPEAKSQKQKKMKKKAKKYPSNPKTCLELKHVFIARTVQKKHVENDWLSYHFYPFFLYWSTPCRMLAYAPPCCGMLMASLDDSQGPCQVQGAFVTNTNSRTNQCALQWWVWSCYKRKSYVSLLRHTTGPWIWLVTWLPQGRFQAIHPKQPRHARTMLRSYDAKQCSFRNHKAESITGVKKTRHMALKQKVPVPLKQTKTRERPKSLVTRNIPKWWTVCWTKIKI